MYIHTRRAEYVSLKSLGKVPSVKLSYTHTHTHLYVHTYTQSGVRVVEKLGEGTFGKVVLAINRRNAKRWNEGLERCKTMRKMSRLPDEGERVVLKVCMYVCLCVCVCMYVCMCVCVSICMCVHACMHACMHVCMYTCMHTHTYTHTNTLAVCVQAARGHRRVSYMYMYICICIYMCLYMYTYT
jgi:hypothetical protein